ncbi:unnamed protein product [Leuciscus chuanchicus]
MNHTSDREVIMQKMRTTFEYRQHLIHDPEKSTTILSVVPPFLDTKGLILQDFTLLFGSESASRLFERWPTVFKAKYNAYSPCVLLPITYFLKYHHACRSIQEHLEAEENRQPYILATGSSKEAISQFFIVVDKKLIPCQESSSLAAIDELFKVHFVFSISYDLPLKNMYTFLQTTIYGIDVGTTKYLDDLQDLIFEHVFVDPAPYMDEVLKIPILSDLCAEYERPDKEEVISTMVSRFNHQLVGNQHICPDHLETHGEPSSPHRLESRHVPDGQGNPSTSSQRSDMPETCND